MDPSLMTPDEIARRGRVRVDPCLVCSHNWQAHVLQGVFTFEVHGMRLDREIEDACIACDCLEYVELGEEELEHHLGDGHEHRDEESGHAQFVDKQHEEFLRRTKESVAAGVERPGAFVGGEGETGESAGEPPSD